MDEPRVINVWTEMRVSDEGVSITLYSEWRNAQTTQVEDEAWYTFDELQSLSGEIRSNLTLSESTADTISTGQQLDEDRSLSANPDTPELLDYMGLTIEEGDIMVDENAPNWSDNERVVVENVTTIPADEYIIQKNHYSPDKSVAGANPSYPADDIVIEARYLGGDETYAFPKSRLVADT